ncbi:MAG: glutamine-hydrolyzing carbamoyl-phosphate synthase small subunit, partial [Pseudomonadota bacterium]
MENNTTTLHSERKAALLLADGTLFFGDAIGGAGQVYGEICFNTGMTGYQEVLTDPSYSGQIITFTFPHIGNVGCNSQDIESAEERSLGAKGLVVREQITTPSNFRSTLHFNDWLIRQGVVGISGVDTRFLTRHIRQNGAKNAVILSGSQEEINSQLPEVQAKLAAMPSLKGMELAEGVSTKSKYNYAAKTSNAKKIVAIDYGEKLNILRYLSAYGCEVTIVPATTTAEEILTLNPQGIFLSNGPGDPAATGKYAIEVIQKLIATDLPLFGICLGHQLLALALGGKTEKMPQGHRGVNHQVKN